MSKRVVRNLFIAVIIWLPLQYGIVGIVGFYHSEPWPAFVFPGFKSVYVYDEGFEISRTQFEVFTADSDEPVILIPQQLFGDIPLSQVPGFVRTHFSDDGSLAGLSREARQWLRAQAGEAAGREVVAMDVVELREFYSPARDGARRDSLSEVKRIQIEF